VIKDIKIRRQVFVIVGVDTTTISIGKIIMIRMKTAVRRMMGSTEERTAIVRIIAVRTVL
jgi:hypothetical protein